MPRLSWPERLLWTTFSSWLHWHVCCPVCLFTSTVNLSFQRTPNTAANDTVIVDNLGVYGHHAWDLKMKTWTKPNIVVIFILQALLPFTTWLIKATLLCLILASFRPVTWIRYMCYIGITVTFAFYFSNILVSILSCHPRGGVDRISWLVGMAKSSCGGTRGILQKYSLTSGAFNILSDFYILMIPLPAISKLHLTSRKKIGVYLIFSAGALACLMSVVCMVFRVRVYGANDVTVDSLPPFTMKYTILAPDHSSSLILNSVIELSIGLMITCVAPTAKLVRRSLGKTKSWVVHKLPSSRNRLDSDSETDGNFVHAVAAPKKRHLPGGLSEIDSMRTFPTMVETEKTEDSENLDNLTALPRICRHWPGSLPQRSEDNIGYAQ
jgi:hypothetical protein